MTIPPAAALRELIAKWRDHAEISDAHTQCDLEQCADDLDALVARVEGTVEPEHDPDCAIFQWDAFAPCSCGAIACVESQVDRLDAAVGVLEALQAQGIYLHDASGQALDREQFIAAVTKALNSLSESRSPDGDGLPMTTGLGDGASLTSTPNVLTPPQAHVHAREMRSAESSLKPAAGSEPADSHTHRATARVEPPPPEQEPNDSSWVAEDLPECDFAMMAHHLREWARLIRMAEDQQTLLDIADDIDVNAEALSAAPPSPPTQEPRKS